MEKVKILEENRSRRNFLRFVGLSAGTVLISTSAFVSAQHEAMCE